MKKAALHNLGCKVNAYETDAMQELLKNAGYEIVDFSEPADVYVVNTCTVTNMADRKSRQMLHKAKKQNPDAIIVAVGCYVQTSKEQAKADSGIDILLGNNEKSRLLFAIEEYEKDRKKVSYISDMEKDTAYEKMELHVTGEHTRAFIKVQDGCNQFCSYCIIPFARGRIRSCEDAEVLDEIKGLAEKGYKEVVMTGIHLSSYGIDHGSSLMELLEKVDKIDGIERIRLGSIEPNFVTEESVERMSKLDKLCPHFHLSLQSGCDDTLKRMNRRYTTDEYREKCNLLRNVFQNPALTTDVIVGFPGETKEEFQTTKAFIKEIGFYEVHVFKYSPRKGTKAEQMDGQITNPVKTVRSKELLELVEQLKNQYEQSWDNQPSSVLFEEKVEEDGIHYWAGHTPQYIRALCQSEDIVHGQIYQGRITKKNARAHVKFEYKYEK